jgi:hypothetical protein
VRSVVLALVLIACAPPLPDGGRSKGSDPSADSSALLGQLEPKASGFDFTGPRTRPLGERCEKGDAQPDVATACEAIKGQLEEADECQVLCSVPIAKEGKVAGYDFKGFVIENDGSKNPATCQINTAELLACTEAGGKVSSAAGCKSICSKPIAKPGKIAGYIGTKFQVGEAPKKSDAPCQPLYSEEQMGCIIVGGEARRLQGCTKSLCSIPF